MKNEIPLVQLSHGKAGSEFMFHTLLLTTSYPIFCFCFCVGGGGSVIGSGSVPEQGVISKEESRGAISFSEDDDITRIFAEINFIYAEVKLHFVTCKIVRNLKTCFAFFDFIIFKIPTIPTKSRGYNMNIFITEFGSPFTRRGCPTA